MKRVLLSILAVVFSMSLYAQRPAYGDSGIIKTYDSRDICGGFKMETMTRENLDGTERLGYVLFIMNDLQRSAVYLSEISGLVDFLDNFVIAEYKTKPTVSTRSYYTTLDGFKISFAREYWTVSDGTPWGTSFNIEAKAILSNYQNPMSEDLSLKELENLRARLVASQKLLEKVLADQQ